jgi:hypothetical protein
MSRWADLFSASPKGHDNGDSGDNGAANRASVTNVPTVTLPRAAEGDVSPPASVTNVTIVNTYAAIAPGNEEAAEFTRDATEGFYF